MTPSDLTERIADAYAGAADVELLTAVRDPSTDAAKVTLAIRAAAAVPVSLASIPGLADIAALEARLSPDTEGVIARLDYDSDFQEIASAAAALSRQGRERDAARLRKRLVRLRLVAAGPDSPDTALAISGLALSYYRQDKFQHAQLAYEQVVEIRSKALGTHHTDTAIALSGLGRALEGLARFDEAADCHRRALAILEPALSARHPDTAVSYRDLGCTLYAQGDFEGARHYMQRAVAVAEDIDGPDDPNTARLKVNLGSIAVAQGHFDEARSLFEDSLAIFEYALEPDDIETSWALLQLGSLYLAQDDAESARNCFERALTFSSENNYADYLLLVTLENNLGLALWLIGETHAHVQQIQAIDHASMYLGNNNPVTKRLQRVITGLERSSPFVGPPIRLAINRLTFEGRILPVVVITRA